VKEPNSWWYHFKSVVCFGKVHIIDDPVTKDVKLRLLGAKYFPESYDISADMAQSAPNAVVLELEIEHLSGKHVREK
jgi:nitroimidazol reductase NimA-like FMN-containing flavoprotein (pyridoxamine 5'-phosphate oxidase superfamily)